MTQREKLREELEDKWPQFSGWSCVGNPEREEHIGYDLIADFILADRGRTVEPLRVIKEKILRYTGIIGWISQDEDLRKGYDETLKNAGIEEI